MKNFSTPLWLITALLTLIGTPSPSRAQIATGVSANFQNYECNLSGLADGMPGCRAATFTNTSEPIALINDSTKLTCGSGTYCGARSDAGTTAVLPIDAFGTCAWVDNYSTNSLFVPFGSSTDWQDFRTNAPINDKHLIVITNCALPYSVSNSPKTINVTPYADCDTAAVAVPDIYGRSPNPGSRIPASIWTAPAQTFTCHNGMTSITSNLQWVAGDSTSVGRNQLSWNQHFTYSPDIQFTVTDSSNPANSGSNISVAADTPITLSWTTTGATRCQPMGGWSSDTAIDTGVNPVRLTPTGKTTYTLECSNDVGASTATVVVNAVCKSGTTWNGSSCAPDMVSKIDIAGFVIDTTVNHGGYGRETQIAANAPEVIDGASGAQVFSIVTYYNTDGVTQQVTSQVNHEGSLFIPVPCEYQPNIAAGYHCFAEGGGISYVP